MAKAKQARKGKRSLNKLAQEVKQAIAQPEVQQPAPQGAQAIREVLVVTGGTKDKPVRENASLVTPVTEQEIEQYGNDRKRVSTGLCMNLLAGTALPRGVLNKDAPCWSQRSVRTDKMAFFKLLECGLTVPQMGDAWTQVLAERKRYDAPTLQALSKAVRAYKILGGQLEARVSPMEKFARDCLGIMNNRLLHQDEILRAIREKLTEKANYDAVVAPAPAVRVAAAA